jgi:hypothetical protein
MSWTLIPLEGFVDADGHTAAVASVDGESFWLTYAALPKVPEHDSTT